MKNLYSIKTAAAGVSFKDADAKKGIITGYFANFDNIDSDGDIIRKGAFKKSILEWGPQSTSPRIKHLLNHNSSQPLGKITMLTEDTKGLAYESMIGTHTLGLDFIKMVESDLVTEHSIGYQTMKRNQLQDYEGYMKNPGDGWFELTDLKLYEGSSLTAWGANPLTPVTGLKGEFDLQELINRQANLEKFCRDSTASDETIQLLLIECKQLTQTIIDIKDTQQALTTEQAKDIELKEALSIFKTLKN